MRNPTYDELVAENERLRKRVAELENRIVELEREVELLLRRSKRQAAPFSKSAPKENPKRPGRKAGEKYGAKGHRPAPAPEDIDEKYDVPLPGTCPHCGGGVDEDEVEPQYQVELPRKPIYRRFDIHIGHCHDCGKRLQGQHALQTSDALGAAASQLGPVLQSAVVMLNKEMGLSHGKVERLLRELFGIELTRGGSAQVILRAGNRCEPLYGEIEGSVRASPYVVPDETGWRVGGNQAWLHVLVGREATLFAIDPTRSSVVAERVLGKDYAGVLIHDGWSPYDNFNSAVHQQCVSHVMRRAHELLEKATRGAVRFPRYVLGLFTRALTVRDAHDEGHLSDAALVKAHATLEKELTRLVEPVKSNATNERFAAHLWRHATEWLTFLKLPGIDATNFRAEQAIRPAVVNRKVWGGNRTWPGARAQTVLTSVAATCRQQGRSAVETIAARLRGETVSLMPVLAPALPG